MTAPTIETVVTSTNSVNTIGATVPTAPEAMNRAVTVGRVTLAPPATVVPELRNVSRYG